MLGWDRSALQPTAAAKTARGGSLHGSVVVLPADCIVLAYHDDCACACVLCLVFALQTKAIGVILPPPDIRAIVDKTAQFVAKNGA